MLPLRVKIALAIAGLVIGIPTSYSGYLWCQTKFAKQQANCITDLYASFGDSISGLTEQQALESKFDTFSRCNADVDPEIGSIAFIRSEVERRKRRE